MISINRLLVRNVVVATVGLCAVWAAGFFFYSWSAATRQFDDVLSEDVATIIELTELNSANAQQPAALRDGTRFELEFRNLVAPESEALIDARYFQLWASTGLVLARSASLGGAELEAPADAATTPSFLDVTLPNGQRGRAAVVRFLPRLDRELQQQGFQRTSEHTVLLVMARSRSRLDDSWAFLVQGFLVLGFFLPIVTFLVVRQAVRHGLQPINRLANEVSNVDASTLGSRLSSESVPEELRPVVTRLNDLFARLDTAFQREKRLTADVAHELRSPIAELRVLAEMRLQAEGPADAAVRHDYEAVLEIAMQMERELGTLLALARCESNAVEVTPRELEFDALIRKTWSAHMDAARARDLTAHFELPEHTTVVSDPALLAAVLTNLFANAVAYAPSGGAIYCEIRPQNGRVQFRLVNAAKQLDSGDVEHVFEPFWRKDAARSDLTHSGLGLTLASAYSSLLGLNLAAFLPEPGVFAVTLSAPAGAMHDSRMTGVLLATVPPVAPHRPMASEPDRAVSAV